MRLDVLLEREGGKHTHKSQEKKPEKQQQRRTSNETSYVSPSESRTVVNSRELMISVSTKSMTPE